MGDCQGVKTPRPLISVQKGTQKTSNYQKTPRDREAQDRVRRKHGGGGQEDRRTGTGGTTPIGAGSDRAEGRGYLRPSVYIDLVYARHVESNVFLSHLCLL